MKYAKLNNGLEIPMLGFGVFQVADGNECYDAVKCALEAGYRHIDTAAVYRNEASVGRAIKDSGVKREDIFLTTKVWNDVQRNGIVADAFQQSLDALQTDYLDLYLVHWAVRPKKYVDTWKELEKIYKSGRTKAIGVSNFMEKHIEDIKAVWETVPVINQVELHPEFSQKPLRDFCQKLGIVVQAYTPLGGSKNVERMLKNPILNEIGAKYNKSAAQVILRWNIQSGIVTIPRSIKPDRIKANFDIFDFELSAEDIAKVDAIDINERLGADPDTFEF